MKRLVRSVILTGAALAIAVGPVYASGNCAPFVSGTYVSGPAWGYLIGQSKVTLHAGLDYLLSGSVEMEFCVGTYNMMGRQGLRFRIQLRCDNYWPWTLL